LYILLPSKPWPGKVQPPLERPEMVSTLLHHGADPNFLESRGPYKTSPWSNLFWYIRTARIFDRGIDPSERLRPSFVRIMKLLLVAGADLHCRSEKNGIYDTESMVLLYGLKRFPEEARDLLDEITHQKILREANELEQDEECPPRKKACLISNSELTASSLRS
jgi:hypothetical protein